MKVSHFFYQVPVTFLQRLLKANSFNEALKLEWYSTAHYVRLDIEAASTNLLFLERLWNQYCQGSWWESTIPDLAGDLIATLATRNDKLGLAESCTGGAISARLVQVAGASKALLGGIVAYSPLIKTSLLSVPESVLDQYGAVSASCALHMAHGAVRALECDLAVSITGIASSSCNSKDPELGVAYIALAQAHTGRQACIKVKAASEDRRQVIDHFVDIALCFARLQLLT